MAKLAGVIGGRALPADPLAASPTLPGALAFGLRLWASVTLALFVAYWLQLDNPFWAATSAGIVCQPSLGASLRKASFRMIGTIVGALVFLLLIACFPQSRIGLIVALALWCGLCGFAATVLRNFAGYGAALAGYTAVIIAADALPNPLQSFDLAVTRASEICLGIVCAGVVLSLTDMGSARTRVRDAVAHLAWEARTGFLATLREAGGPMEDSTPRRRALVERTIALSGLLDEAAGESSEIRARSFVLQAAVDGLFDAMSEWRAVANHLEPLDATDAGEQAAAILAFLPQDVANDEPFDRTAARPAFEAAASALRDSVQASPAGRLMADRTAGVLLGLARAANGATFLSGEPWSGTGQPNATLRTPDLAPALLNGLRATLVVLLMSAFWVVTAWPAGTYAVLFAAIVVILLSPRGDDAFGGAIGFWVGTMIAAGLAALADFAVLPGREGFASLALVLAIFLVPTAALSTQAWQRSTFVAMSANFLPLLAPANVPAYDTVGFYNLALAIAVGVGFAALSITVLPQLPPGLRARRLVALSLADVRRLATRRDRVSVPGWQALIYGRLAALPSAATPLQRSQLVTILWVGVEVLRIEEIAAAMGAGLEDAMAALGTADVATARHAMRAAGARLAAGSPTSALVMRARAALLGLDEALGRHGALFGSEMIEREATGALR